MKQTLFILLSILILACNQQNSNHNGSLENKPILDSINDMGDDFDWLVGKWERLNDEGEKKTFENWIKESNFSYKGHGFVMKGLDTVWQEQMVFSKKDSIWVLSVATPGNKDLVEFKLASYDAHSFTVENSNHDFPKKIKYWVSNGKLKALVAGDDNELNFEFKHIK